jgi:hypothetical protein
VENAFATGRLQHTSEFHDAIPLPLFNITNNDLNSRNSLKESLDKEEETKQPDVTQSDSNESDSV